MNNTDYRHSHSESGYGALYNRSYTYGYYSALWNRIERPILSRLFKQYGGSNKKCLDFACGTGRITNLASREFGYVLGVDVSAAMLSEANKRPNIEYKQIDLTVDDLNLMFDAILAFRFFLNADNKLRQLALKAIYEHMKKGGVLICNIHMNAYSPMGCVYRVLKLIFGKNIHNTCKESDFVELLESSGFSIEHIQYYGFLPRPGRFLPALCEQIIKPCEHLCKLLHIPSVIAQSFVVVARK